MNSVQISTAYQGQTQTEIEYQAANPLAMRGRSFLNTAEFPQQAIHELVNRALKLKRQHEDEDRPLLKGLVVGMVFFNPSLRTKTSMASGIARLGGTAIDLTAGQSTYAFEFEDGVVMDGATQEHIKEAAPVLSQYCDAIAVRSSELITRGSTSRPTPPARGPRRGRTRWCAASPSTPPCP